MKDIEGWYSEYNEGCFDKFKWFQDESNEITNSIVCICFFLCLYMFLSDHEDTQAILTDDSNRTISGNVAMQVAPPGGKVQN